MRWLLTVSVLCLCFNAPVWAGMTHDQALQAVRDGKILPILPIIEKIEQNYDGRVVDVELSDSVKEDGEPAFIYRVAVVTADGRLFEVLVDAPSGDIIGVGGRGVE